MEDLSEKEQIDAIRAWWSENGNFVIGGVVVGVAIIVGWNTWQGNIASQEVAASTYYEDIMTAAARGNLDAAETAAGALFAEHGGSDYAGLSRLAMARIYMDNGRDQDAVDVLQPLASDPAGGEQSHIARLRLGRVLLYQGKSDEVIALVNEQPESGFSAEFNELLGDAYEASGQYAEAEAAYVAALNDNPVAPTIDVEFIQLKINDLPIPGEAEAEAPITESEAPIEETPAGDGESGAAEEAAEPAAVEEVEESTTEEPETPPEQE